MRKFYNCYNFFEYSGIGFLFSALEGSLVDSSEWAKNYFRYLKRTFEQKCFSETF
jgi:hypothetical protein